MDPIEYQGYMTKVKVKEGFDGPLQGCGGSPDLQLYVCACNV